MSEQSREKAEAKRVVAETERVEAEVDRVDAEAGEGGQALEEGRVQAEEKRVEAETLREEREDRRRIAEGGADQHVPGNTMLQGRVEAEQRRQTDRQRMYRRVAGLIALPLALVALIPSVVGIVLVHRQANHLSAEIRARCLDIRTNREALRTTVIGGFTALGYSYNADDDTVTESGAPLDYYTTHPKERATQLQANLDTIRRFPPILCDRKAT